MSIIGLMFTLGGLHLACAANAELLACLAGALVLLHVLRIVSFFFASSRLGSFCRCGGGSRRKGIKNRRG